MRRVHLYGERELAELVRRDVLDDHVIRIAGKGFATIGYIADAITHGRNRGVEIQFPAVVTRVVMPREMQSQIAKGLIRHLPYRIGKKLPADDRSDFFLLALENELADL